MVAPGSGTTVMASGMQEAVSGMRAEQAQFDVAANNVANADTPGYSQEQVSQSALTGGGVQTTGVGVLPGIPPAEQPQVSNVDLGLQMANMMLASTLYGADAKMIGAQGRMNQSVLDILA
jgi:flagellar basal body rod protein FlgG